MAGVNFTKLKSPQEVKAVMRHCDKFERIKHDHSNGQINKSLTSRNSQLKRDYKQTCQLYDHIIEKLDSQEGANKRKDRVTCFGLEIPYPLDIQESNKNSWRNRVFNIVSNMYGFDNILQVYDHRDEQHEYIDTESHEKKMSRDHIHILVIPEHEGKLNGKWFSSKANMMKLNNTIHEMSNKEYSIDFMNGTKRKSKKSVETLKNESELLRIQEEAQKQAENIVKKANEDLIEKQSFLTSLKAQISQLEELIEEKYKEMDKIESEANKRLSEANEKLRSLVPASVIVKAQEYDKIMKQRSHESKMNALHNNRDDSFQNALRKKPRDLPHIDYER